MHEIEVQPLGPIDATVSVPGSKSLTNRALPIAALAAGSSTLSGCLFSDDPRFMLESLARLGVACQADEAACAIRVDGCSGRFPKSGAELFIGNAGTAMRFLTAAAAACGTGITIDGIPRMRQRPIGELLGALRQLGAAFEGTSDFPPVRVLGGGLAGGRCRFRDPQSSQYVSAVLMAAPFARSPVELEVEGTLVSEPYVEMTISAMAAFGVKVERTDRNVCPTESDVCPTESDVCPTESGSKLGGTGIPACPSGAVFRVGAPQQYRACDYAVEPDASGASYFLAIAAVTGGCIRIDGLGTDSRQGDARFIDVLARMGCKVDSGPRFLQVRGGRLKGIDVDLGAMPDMAQTLAAVAMFAQGPTTIRNVANLRIKETDRIAALYNELSKLGARVEVLADGLVVHPPERIRPAGIDTYDDHRMAMSFAVIGSAAAGVVIRDPGCVSKTFPDFFDRLARLQSGPRA